MQQAVADTFCTNCRIQAATVENKQNFLYIGCMEKATNPRKSYKRELRRMRFNVDSFACLLEMDRKQYKRVLSQFMELKKLLRPLQQRSTQISEDLDTGCLKILGEFNDRCEWVFKKDPTDELTDQSKGKEMDGLLKRFFGLSTDCLIGRLAEVASNIVDFVNKRVLESLESKKDSNVRPFSQTPTDGL